MALEFTDIPDRQGPAVYILGDGSSQNEVRLRSYGEEVDRLTPEETQVVYLDPRQGDGLRVKEFYGLHSLPCILIVMDDDTIYQVWENQLPNADQVVYALSQINGSMR